MKVDEGRIMQEKLHERKQVELYNQDYISIIGKIRMDLRHYPGEDRYCDGEVEDEILDIVKNHSSAEFPKIIEEKASWPILYHLSPLRENIVEWLPITREMKVLEIGSGCGAITGALARKAQEVTCVDLSKKRSSINAYRHQEYDNITIHIGNFQDVEPDLAQDYDLICLIGVFEYGQSYLESKNPYEDFLKIIGRHLKKDGHIAIAIENKFGLKYWAGCREDHVGKYFSGLEDYPEGGPARTFTGDGLKTIARSCGFEEIQMYYPYPDYKFPTCIYSDRRLPVQGELCSNLRNFDRDRLLLFDEKKVFDTIIKEEKFPLFSNSYLMILGPEMKETYVKYSNDRDVAYQIRTVLAEDPVSGQKCIEKHPLSKESWPHIRSIREWYEKLTARYEGCPLTMNRCELKEDRSGAPYVELEYLEGLTLAEVMDDLIARGAKEEIGKLFASYLERVSYNEEANVKDYDLIFSNIIIEQPKDGGQRIPDVDTLIRQKWTAIDYEWTFEEDIKSDEVAFRAMNCFYLEDPARRCDVTAVCDKMVGVSGYLAEDYRYREQEFQEYVTGKRKSMAQMRELIGNPVYTLETFCKRQADLATGRSRIQIYEDTGSGFSEDHSVFVDADPEIVMSTLPTGRILLHIPVPKGRDAVRIDPCSDYCIVYIDDIRWNGFGAMYRGFKVKTNGFKISRNTYGFLTEDPQICVITKGLDSPDYEENLLQIAMEVTRLPLTTVEDIKRKNKRKPRVQTWRV